MKMLRLKGILIFLLITVKGLSQGNAVFHHITTENGLIYDDVQTIAQDNKGFLWIGTAKGLCRYDGSHFISFTHDPLDSNSISNNDISSICQDNKNNFWIGTFGGLNMLNLSTGNFKHIQNKKNFKPLENNFISSILQIDDSHLLFTNGSLETLDLNTSQITKIVLPQNTVSSNLPLKTSNEFHCYKVVAAEKSSWWLTGETCIIQYNAETKKFNLLSQQKNIPISFKLVSTWDCSEDKFGNTWIASGAGLFEYKTSTGLKQHYPKNFLTKDIKTKWVKCVLCDDDGSIWFGTNNGLFHYFPSTKKYFVYRNDPRNISSISDNNISCLFKDKQHILWIGTSNGLNALYPQQSQFFVYKNIPGDNNSIANNITNAALKDAVGNIWAGTQSGLQFISASKKYFNNYIYFDKRLKENLTEYNVWPLLWHDSSSLWVGTWGGGLQLFNTKTKQFTASYVHLPNDTTSICNNFCDYFCKDDENNLWIATWSGGIDKFDTREKKFYHFNTTNKKCADDYLYTCIFYNGVVWAGSSEGLFKYDSGSGVFKPVALTPTKSGGTRAILRLEKDRQNNLWIATNDGLIKYDDKKETFETIKIFDGLSIQGLLADNSNVIWLATDEGLKTFDLTTQQTHTYSLKDGLPVMHYPVACFFSQANDDEIFLNSSAGLIHFYPKHIYQNTEPPSLFLTAIKNQNHELKNIGDVTNLHSLNLNYNQNYLSFDFAAMNLINPSLNQYAYRLSGVDKDWVYTNHNEAVYTNLKPGNYLFKVKASNDAGVWSKQEISLRIYIKTPWWQTGWFYLLCVMAASAIVYIIYYARMQKKIETLKLRNKISADLHDEIGSTLSSVHVYSEVVKKQLSNDSQTVKILHRISESTLNMMESMSDIVWAINPKNDAFENLFIRMQTFASQVLEAKNIEIVFSVDAKLNERKLNMEQRQHLYLIFKEAINNVSKYSGASKTEISIEMKDQELLLKISDNGKGFNVNNYNEGNGLDTMRMRAVQLKAQLKIESKESMGTTVLLCMKNP